MDKSCPLPVYLSWTDYLARTTYGERMKRCYAASKRANRVHRCQWRKPISGRGEFARMMREVIKGPCGCCGNLPGTQCSGEIKLTSRAIWNIIEKARGRCMYCGSLALEGRPSHSATGAPLPWEAVGRRVGSLEHIESFLDGRINRLENLGWACLWCNVHPGARVPNAPDRGGFYPEE